MLKYVAAENIEIGSVITIDKDNAVRKCGRDDQRLGVTVEYVPRGSLVVMDDTGLMRVYKFPERKG